MTQRPSPPTSSPAPPSRTYDLVEADYPLWSGPPRGSILVCTQPRSGSTLLGEALFAAGGFGCPLEYFHRGFRPAFAERWHVAEPQAYLQAVHCHRTDPTGTLGVKLFWPDVEELYQAHAATKDKFEPGSLEPRACSPEAAVEIHRAIGRMIAELFPNASFIHLVRKDRLRQAVSAVVATQTQVWRLIPGIQDNPPREPPRFEFHRIAGMLSLGEYCRRNWEEFFAANQIEGHPVSYESLDDDFAATMRRLFATLHRPDAAPLPPRMRRQADRVSEEMVLQFLREMRQQAPGVRP